mmetsp:Transcript_9324/g.22799  ORF Transcript_9324/g.22799 Transcript_9324/m.22799 type:complete len:107 (+) Transcript_9324:1814-2134(+)
MPSTREDSFPTRPTAWAESDNCNSCFFGLPRRPHCHSAGGRAFSFTSLRGSLVTVELTSLNQHSLDLFLPDQFLHCKALGTITLPKQSRIPVSMYCCEFWTGAMPS